MIKRPKKIKNPQGVRFDQDVFDAINSLPDTSEHGFSWQVNRILRLWCELNRLIEIPASVPVKTPEQK